ncbi:MAG TPA: ABC transporter permease [Pyrinomonadaceae bacterium]|nr:ABC transporter permease [Pyrinomonadaceae bacterium]
MGEIFTLALLFSSLRLATPLIFAALGGLFSERSGVINIALEGLMLAGAFTAAVVTYQVGDPYIGVAAGVAAGAFLAFIYAVACIKFEADQVVAGMAINFLMIGLPALISGAIYDSSGSTPQIDKILQLPDFYNRISIATIVALALVPICWWIMYKTPFGLRIRATGEHPEAAETAGVNVIRLRYIAVTISGVLAGLGGAYLSIGQSSLFTRNMTAGRGFIALAALILAKWRPVPVLGACLFFGLTEALSIQIQGASWAKIGGEEIPVQFIQIIPYLLTIIVLAGFIGLSRAPKALGIPYSKED